MAKKIRTMQGKTIDFDDVKRKNKNAVPLGVKAIDRDAKPKKAKKVPAPVVMHTLTPKRNVPDINTIEQRIKAVVPGRFTESVVAVTEIFEVTEEVFNEFIEPTKQHKGKK